MGNPYDDGRFIEGIAIDWDAVDPHSYERRIPALRALERLDFDEPVTFLVGENGTGKSTLLEALAVAYGFNAEGGTLNYRFSTYDDVSDLGDAMRVGRGAAKRSRAISSVPRASSMWRPRRGNMGVPFRDRRY